MTRSTNHDVVKRVDARTYFSAPRKQGEDLPIVALRLAVVAAAASLPSLAILLLLFLSH
jgi:hypothetical protein